MDGQQLINESRHKGCRTQSRGFCFTADEPKVAIQYLKGNVDTDFCVTMNIPDSMLHKTKAIYRDWQHDDVMSHPLPMNADDVPMVEKTEYCLTRYSRNRVTLLGFTTEYSHLPGIKETQALLQRLGYRPTARL